MVAAVGGNAGPRQPRIRLPLVRFPHPKTSPFPIPKPGPFFGPVVASPCKVAATTRAQAGAFVVPKNCTKTRAAFRFRSKMYEILIRFALRRGAKIPDGQGRTAAPTGTLDRTGVARRWWERRRCGEAWRRQAEYVRHSGGKEREPSRRRLRLQIVCAYNHVRRPVVSVRPSGWTQMLRLQAKALRTQPSYHRLGLKCLSGAVDHRRMCHRSPYRAAALTADLSEGAHHASQRQDIRVRGALKGRLDNALQLFAAFVCQVVLATSLP